MYTPQRFPPHLQYVATLPCEIRQSKNVTNFTLNVTINTLKCSTEQRSAVDSRRRLTNFKMLVSQSVSAVLRQSV